MFHIHIIITQLTSISQEIQLYEKICFFHFSQKKIIYFVLYFNQIYSEYKQKMLRNVFNKTWRQRSENSYNF